ncbi:MAG: hypothetical protein JWP65_1162 [Ramlibacter sp.]|uniref:hypothetical protein n=1 Tax=Ramlibacter sp. TaxID=1917967 RepID=UPI002638BE93|nr:hypothetical protein [Ramlibacter sp.]MDB5750741.1 hypothetical protein [Ramlibacter sp.]
MMDFLRQLNPARETDAARAVAVLPSRFSGLHPLQGIDDQARSGSIGNDETSLWRQPGLPPVANPMAAQRPAAAAIPPAQATPMPQAGKPRQSENIQAMPPVAVPAKASGAPEASLFSAVQGRAGGNAGRARSASLQATRPAAAVVAALPALEQAGAPPAPAQEAWPLSDASLAQRVPRPQDDGPVVHVTIGRIEVVAHTAAAPAPARGPAPRQPSVTLADYLRGSPGGRP